MSPGRFVAILRYQLQVSQEDFWTTLRTGKPAFRPSTPIPDESAALPAWIVRVLKDDLGKSEADIARMTPEEAHRLVDERWSRSNNDLTL